MRKPWKMGPLRNIHGLPMPSPLCLPDSHHQILNSQVVVRVCACVHTYVRAWFLRSTCVGRQVGRRRGRERGRGRRPRASSPPASERPAFAHEREAAWPFDPDPMLCLVQGIFKFSFILLSGFPPHLPSQSQVSGLLGPSH